LKDSRSIREENWSGRRSYNDSESYIRSMSPNKPLRLNRIFQSYDPPLFFITFCTVRRRKILANTRTHNAFVGYAKRALDHNVAVGRYVIMPDHIHLIVAGDREFDLGMWVRGLKRVVAAAVIGGRHSRNSAAETAATTPTAVATTFSPVGKLPSLWERGFFDHSIRNSESYAQKWDYVRENPVRAGLVSREEDWPFQGEIVEIAHV
jgi:putative transposase